MRSILYAATLLVTLAACAPPNGGGRMVADENVNQANFYADIQAIKSRQQEMRQRLDDLENRLGGAREGASLDDLGARLARLEEAVTRIASTLSIDAGLRGPAAAAPSAAQSYPGASPGSSSQSYPGASPGYSNSQPYPGASPGYPGGPPGYSNPAYGGYQSSSGPGYPNSSQGYNQGYAPGGMDGAPTGPITMGPNSDDPAEAIYNMGMEAYNAHNYDRAMSLYAEMLKTYPTHRLAPNALFWQAEANYQSGDFARTALLCDDLVKKYPQNPLVPSAMLKQAAAFKRLGKPKPAKILLQDVVQRFPGSPEARSAQALLKDIR